MANSLRSLKIAIVVFMLLGIYSPLSAQNSTEWAIDNNMLLFFDAAMTIERRSLYVHDIGSITTGAIDAYLNKIDEYSAYISPDDYRLYKKARNPRYGGIGLELNRDETGKIICLPLKNGPAAEAGIKKDDLLHFIDDRDVRQMDLLVVGALIKGEPGTSVKLVIERENQEKSFNLVRESTYFKSVGVDQGQEIPLIKISSFQVVTINELKAALQKVLESPKNKQLIIDLRDNPGGDLSSALECADLFLPSGKLMLIQDEGDEKKEYLSSPVELYPDTNIIIWQNEKTASAGEVFIGALVLNHRAVSVGVQTYGKGLSQSVVELMDGSALVLTTARLVTPDGKPYHHQGLAPTCLIREFFPDDQKYLQYTKHCIKDRMAERLALFNRKKEERHTTAHPTSLETTKSINYFACLDQEFNDRNQARHAIALLTESNNNPSKFCYYVKKEDSSKILICGDTYPAENMAAIDKETRETFYNEKFNVQNSRVCRKIGCFSDPDPGSVTKNQVEPYKEYYIRAGTYRNIKILIGTLESLHQMKYGGIVDLHLNENSLSDKQLLALNIYGFTIRVVIENSREKVAYIVYLGPFDEKNVQLLNDLKEQGKIDPHSQWVSELPVGYNLD